MKRDRDEGPNGAELGDDATKRVKVEDGAEEHAARVPAPAGAAAGLPEQAPAAELAEQAPAAADQAHAAAEQAQAAVEQAPPAAEAPVEVKQEYEEDEDDHIALPRSTTRSAVKKGHECPYLDTISRQVCSNGCARLMHFLIAPAALLVQVDDPGIWQQCLACLSTCDH